MTAGARGPTVPQPDHNGLPDRDVSTSSGSDEEISREHGSGVVPTPDRPQAGFWQPSHDTGVSQG
jgi:hypothetical protein